MRLQHDFNDEMDTYNTPGVTPTNKGTVISTFTTDSLRTVDRHILDVLTRSTGILPL